MKFYDQSAHRTKDVSMKDIIGWEPWGGNIALVFKKPIWKKGDSLQRRTLMVSQDAFSKKIVGINKYNVFTDEYLDHDYSV